MDVLEQSTIMARCFMAVVCMTCLATGSLGVRNVRHCVARGITVAVVHPCHDSGMSTIFVCIDVTHAGSRDSRDSSGLSKRGPQSITVDVGATWVFSRLEVSRLFGV